MCEKSIMYQYWHHMTDIMRLIDEGPRILQQSKELPYIEWKFNLPLTHPCILFIAQFLPLIFLPHVLSR